MIFSLLLVFIAVLLTGISQLLLKIGSKKGAERDRFLAPYLNFFTFTGYVLLLLVTIISILALREVPLKVFYALASLNFVFVPALSWRFLGESVNKQQFLFLFLIIIGIAVFNF